VPTVDSPGDGLGQLRERVASLPWFHTMDLAPGVRTPGVYDPRRTLPRLRLPDRLDGKSVLDVGAWDGFYSFEMERRGARVLATDSYCWDGGGWGTKASFDLAREALASKVADTWIDPMDLSPEAVDGTFDVVLLLGVLYHVKEPLRLLERVRSVTDGLLVLETETGMLLTRRPAAEFFPGTELNADPTNWWAPNVPAVLGMLRASGFRSAEVVWRRRLPWRAARWARHVLAKRDVTLMQALTTDRIVFHAHV
jgi:tRNA (mo5U34)-methyltransferase